MTDEQIVKELRELGISEPEARQCLVSRDAIIPVIEGRITSNELQTKFNYPAAGNRRP
jgi:hypothetical protein